MSETKARCRLSPLARLMCAQIRISAVAAPLPIEFIEFMNPPRDRPDRAR